MRPEQLEDRLSPSVTMEFVAPEQIQVGDQFEVQAAFYSPGLLFSAFADIHYDPNVLRADYIVHSAHYQYLRTGTIDDGTVDEVGAVGWPLSGEPVVFSIYFTAIGEGQTTIYADAGESVFSEITYLGSDLDHRHTTDFASIDIDLSQ